MAYEIPLEMPGLDKVLSGFDKIIEKSEELNRKTKELEQTAGNIGGRGSRGGGGGAGGILGGGGGKWTDPWERLDRLNVQKALGQMEGLGDSDMKGLNLAIARAQRAADKGEKELNKQPKTQAELIMDALMTSRLGFSGGKMQVMPLMNRMADAGLIDPSKYMNQIMNFGNMSSLIPVIAKLAIPAAAAVAAGTAVVGFANNASARMRDGGGAYWTGGGTPGQTGITAALGSFIGLTAQQSAQRAVELGDRLKSGGYGASYMRSKGIVDQGPWTVNKLDNYLRTVDELRSIKEDTKAVRIARDLGMTEELRFRDLSDATYRQLKASLGAAGSEDQRKASEEYEAKKTILGNTWDQLVRTAGIPVLNQANSYLGPLASGDIYGFARNVAFSMWPSPGDNGGKKSSGSSATNGNTEAIKELTRTMKQQAEMLGGGPRARGAVPSAWKYEQMENALQSDAISLGAFFI